eukprot:scaffold29045_cov55-Phaeocystis_antarctica.AAC.2
MAQPSLAHRRCWPRWPRGSVGGARSLGAGPAAPGAGYPPFSSQSRPQDHAAGGCSEPGPPLSQHHPDCPVRGASCCF